MTTDVDNNVNQYIFLLVFYNFERDMQITEMSEINYLSGGWELV